MPSTRRAITLAGGGRIILVRLARSLRSQASEDR